LVEPVQDGARIDQCLSIFQDERRNAADRVDAAHSLEIGEHRAGIVLIGVKPSALGDMATLRTKGESYCPTRIMLQPLVND
jgi:hypothetical protein